ncbi:MAG: ABC transporter ATP-binding protein [Microbacteriaceae bacterium]|nr:ABC transporter ATP-binding protein [Microbacteriaceae bacterium]
MSAVELDRVSKGFGQIAVLNAVNLSILAGSTTVIVGASGSGKTTLLRLISGFEMPDSGTISLSGERVAGSGKNVPAHRRGIGLVSQEGSLFPHLSVEENIAFGMGDLPRRNRQRAVEELLDMVSLERSYRTRRPDELSGGQQQRVALARALARKPSVMLLDEPFSALDTGLRAATRDAISATLRQQSITTVLVTHDQSEALSFGDQLAVLRKGRLVQVGSPRELYFAPREVSTAKFLGDAIVLPATVGAGTASCAFGIVVVAPTAVRGAAFVMFRPEHLVVKKSDSGGSAVVELVEFGGAEVNITVRLDGLHSGRGAVVKIRQNNDLNVARGDRVVVSTRQPGVVVSPDQDNENDQGSENEPELATG